MGIFSPNNNPTDGTYSKITAYTDYINKHIADVKKAFEQNGTKLLESFPGVEESAILKVIKNHDDSKSSNIEFGPYRKKFFPVEGEKLDENEFKMAVLRHYHKNPHHWNYWVMVTDAGVEALDMPDECIIEMILDWTAMGYHYDNTPLEYYDTIKNKIVISESTRTKLEKALNSVWGSM